MNTIDYAKISNTHKSLVRKCERLGFDITQVADTNSSQNVQYYKTSLKNKLEGGEILELFIISRVYSHMANPAYNSVTGSMHCKLTLSNKFTFSIHNHIVKRLIKNIDQ